MPNRMLRDWTDSEKMNVLTVHAERFFVRLIMKADDYGCFFADPRLLKAHLFPLLLDEVREADISRWMAECQKAGLIALYETNSKKYLEIKSFDQRLRAKKRKFPICQSDDGHMSVICPLEVEENTEVEEKGSVKNFWDREADKKQPIEHCLEVALKDEKFVSANKTSRAELEIFNDFLRKTGESEKTFLDYKKHFGNKKLKNPELFRNAKSGINKQAIEAFKKTG